MEVSSRPQQPLNTVDVDATNGLVKGSLAEVILLVQVGAQRADSVEQRTVVLRVARITADEVVKRARLLLVQNGGRGAQVQQVGDRGQAGVVEITADCGGASIEQQRTASLCYLGVDVEVVSVG